MKTLGIAAAAGMALGLAGCVVSPPQVYTGTATVSAPVASYPPVPPPRAEVVPPRPQGERWVWVPGHQQWNGNRYVWAPGRYMERPAAANRWVPAHWERRPNGNVWVAGHWA